jgi:hypothetical protein
VTGLRHCEAAQQIQADDPRHVRLVVALGAEILNGPAEKAPLHAGLHHQRQIGHRQHLDPGHRRGDVAVAAVFLLEPVLGGAVRRHDLHLLHHLGAGDHGVGGVVRAEDLVGEFFSHSVLHVAPTAVQRVA